MVCQGRDCERKLKAISTDGIERKPWRYMCFTHWNHCLVAFHFSLILYQPQASIDGDSVRFALSLISTENVLYTKTWKNSNYFSPKLISLTFWPLVQFCSESTTHLAPGCKCLLHSTIQCTMPLFNSLFLKSRLPLTHPPTSFCLCLPSSCSSCINTLRIKFAMSLRIESWTCFNV